MSGSQLRYRYTLLCLRHGWHCE